MRRRCTSCAWRLWLDVRPTVEDFAHDGADERDVNEVAQREKTGAQGIVDIMRVVGDVVGDGRSLRFEAGERAGQKVGAGRDVRGRAGIGERTIVLEDALERLPAQIEPVMLGVAVLEPGHDAERLQIVIEAAAAGHLLVEHALARMTEGRVAEIVGERHGLGKIFVEPQRPGDGARHLADLERVRQPGAEMLALVLEEHLRLVLEPTEGGGMDDPVAIALEFRPRRAGIGRKQPAAALGGVGSVGRGHWPLSIGTQRY